VLVSSFSAVGTGTYVLHLAQMPHKTEPPPYEGSLLLDIHAHGRGDSLHAKYRSQQIGIGNLMRPWPGAWSLRFGKST